MDFDTMGSLGAKTNNVAAIFHIFYPDLLEEIFEVAQNLGEGIDYYVTVSEELTDLIGTIRQRFPKAKILPVENRGRDILPFIEVLKRILPLDYELLVKIHTKKSLHRDDGTSWRKDVYEKLLGSSETVAKARKAFQQDSALGILGAQGHVLNNRFYKGGSQDLVQALAKQLGLDANKTVEFPFVASTMFWARPELFKSLIDARIEAAEFPGEPLPPDGTLPHALERFLGFLAIEQGFSVKTISKDGTISDPEPLEIYRYAPVPKPLAIRNVRSLVYYPAYNEAYAIEHLRVTGLYQAAGIELISGCLDGVPDPERVLLGDAVIFQREFPGNLPLYDQIVSKVLQYNKLIFYELDDLLFDLPENHPERIQETYNAALMPMMAAMTEADAVIVTTAELGKVVNGFNDNVIILPNYLDDSTWELRPPKQKKPGKPLTIGYMRSNSHTPDLAIVAPALRKLLSQYEGRLKLEVWGTPIPEELEGVKHISWHPSPSNIYIEFVKFFQTLQFDLVIAPLVDNLFNRCKSGLKFLEYSAIGAAGVYSRLAPYEALVIDGVNGFLASSEDEWVEKLRLLIENPQKRDEMAKAAQETVREKWLLSGNIRTWEDIFGKLTQEFLVEDPNKDLRAHITNTVNRQLYHDRLNDTARLNNLQQDCDQQIKELQEEVARIQSAGNDEEVRGVLKVYREGRNKLSRAANKVFSTGALGKIFTPNHLVNKELLSESDLFDPDYYLRTNPDVGDAGVDPAIHYLKHGWREGRNPSEKFDGNWYLDRNSDVKEAQINPLVHYLRFGQNEDRAIKSITEPTEENRKEITQPSANPIKVPGHLLLNVELGHILAQKMSSSFELALSHDDYLTVTGGVQAVIASEQHKTNQNGRSYLHLYPYKKLPTLADDDPLLYLGLNLDGERLGETESSELISALIGLEDKQITRLSIHHSMGFNQQTIQKLLNLTGNQGVFWLHDYFSLCPSYNLLRNDFAYCGAPDISSNSCQLCHYLQNRKMQQPIFEKLFADNQLEVVSPSQFTYELWQSRFPIHLPARVVPPVQLHWKQPGRKGYTSGEIRVGFLGYPLHYKGWETWLKLTNHAVDKKRFRFYHFSSNKGTKVSGNYQHIETQVTEKKRFAMVENLRVNNIDVALLWSTAAETFSLTLHEALAAGCYILTNPNSGNIQDYIHRNPECGLVLDNEAQLLALFESGDILEKVRIYQMRGKPQADLVFGDFEEVDR